MVRYFHFVAIAALLVSPMACTPVRMLYNPTRAIPLRGLGDGLPGGGITPEPGEGPVYYDSIYVGPYMRPGFPAYTEREDVFRFWRSGHVMKTGGRSPIPKEFYEIVGESMPGIIGRFTVVGNEIYIEVFTSSRGRRWFRVFRGELTKNGFVITSYRNRDLSTWFWWRKIGPCRFVRREVGPMSGTEPAELFVPK